VSVHVQDILSSASSDLLSSLPFNDFDFPIACHCCRVKAGLALKSPNQKTRGFVVKIVFSQ
jgi:hypothetical protein